MASFWKKITSGLDFWDKEENRQQREQFKREDEEERERRRNQAAARNTSRQFAGQQPGDVVTPTVLVPEKPKSLIASQSDFKIEDMLKPEKMAPTNPLLKPELLPKKSPAQIAADKKRAELDELTRQKLPKAIEEEKKRTSWFDRQFTDRNWDKRAEAAARGRATFEYQEKNGWNRDPEVLDFNKGTREKLEKASKGGTSKWVAPVLSTGRVGTGIVEGGAGLYDLLTPGEGQNRVTQAATKKAQEIDKLAEDMDISSTYKTLNVPLEVASYFIPGTVFTKGGKVANFLGKASTKADDVSRLITKSPKLQKFIREGSQELFDPKNVQKELELTGRYMGQDSARGEDIGGGDVAANTAQAVGGAFIPAFLRRGLQKMRGGKVAADATATVGGTTTSQAIDAVTKNAEAPTIPGTLDPIDIPAPDATPPKIDVADGVKTTPSIEELRAQANDLNTPAYQRKPVKDELAAAEQAATNAEVERLGVGDAATDRPAYQHKRDIQSVIDDGQAQLDEFINANPGASRLEIENAQASINAQVMAAIENLQANRYGDTAVNVPDPTNPVALAKADDVAGTPIADFSRSIQAPLQKADVPAPATVQAPSAAAVDANGNPVMATDAQVARQMAEQGMAPSPAPSVAAAQEDAIQAAADRTAAEQVTGTAASSRERAAFAATEDDPILAQEILDTIPNKTRFNSEEMLSIARNNARSQTPQDLINAWSREIDLDMNNPQAWVNALEERKVLNALTAQGVPGAREARINLADAMSKFQSKSGQNLNMLKAAYEELPGDMKAELLIKKIERARKNAGLDMLSDRDTEVLLNRVLDADDAAVRVKTIEDQMADFNRAITSGSATPDARAQLDELNRLKEEALVDLYEKNAVVTDYFGQLSPDAAFGQKLLNWNRISMLSSITGRLFDIASTTGTTALDTANRAISSLFGRVLNRAGVGEGGAKSVMPQLMPSARDLMKAGQTTLDSARGKNQVRDVMAEIQGMGTGRSELQNQSRGRFRNLVKAGTEAPTELTKYIENDEIYRTGRQRAGELGLKGDDAELYADSYSSVATTAEKYAAQQEHLKANMLHNNAVSSKIDAVANQLLNSSSNAGKTTGAILKSMVAPFTRFVGGMTHRTFTDMNVAHNLWQMRKAVKNGDTQMLADNLAKFTTNTTVGIATATVMAETGMLTTQDANGDSYNGLYLHIGDRYIPVGILGLASVPMIVGYGMNQAANAESPADAFTAATTDTLSRVLASTGTAGFFGADNALQTAVSGASSAINPSESGGNEKDFADVLGSTVRQSIPAIFNDVNAVLNQMPGFNPTGEAAETKVLNDDGTQNPLATQAAKIQNTIPGMSQQLPRREGTPARDFLDRMLKGNRETGDMADKRETKEQLSDLKKQLENEGIPVTAEKISDLAKTGDYDKALQGAKYRLLELEADEKATENSKANVRREIEDYEFGDEHGYVPSSDEAVQARAEDGEYDKAIAGWELRLKRDEEEGNTPKSKLDSQRRKIQRYGVFRDRNADPEMVMMYENEKSDNGGVGVTAWRDMMESGDPELMKLGQALFDLDTALLDSGAIKEPKYYWGKGGRGGGRGGSGNKDKFITDIATNSFNEGGIFKPLKAQAATFGERESAIPTIETVPSYSRKLKKISVSRGSR